MKRKIVFGLLPAALMLLIGITCRASEGQGVPPDEALQRLIDGNARFLSGQMQHPNTGKERVTETAAGQHPFVAMLGCSDSRVPVETLFDQGIGDIFTIRVAGNVADTDEIGSLEYAVEHLGVRLIVVLGHTRCGAVTAVVTGAHVAGSLPGLLDNIKPAAAEAVRDNPKLKGAALVPKTINYNVWRSVEDMLRKSAVLREAVREGKVKVMGVLYHVESGGIEVLGEHFRQDQLSGKKAEKKEAGKSKKH